MPSYLPPPLRLLLVLLLCAARSGWAQPAPPAAKPPKEVVNYLASFQRIIQQHALFADSLNWKQLSHDVAQQAQGLTNLDDCQPILNQVMRALRQAGDKHSFYLPVGKARKYTSPSYAGQQAQSQYLEPGIGYVKIPELNSMDASVGQTFSQSMRRQLAALQTQHAITGWVIDLRHNTGGNMYPMLDGLQALLGEETYGYFLLPRLKKETRLRLHSERASARRAGEAAITSPRVAVLLDSLTASSGEMVAIAFQGRPNTHFFGQPSAGYITTNQPFRLSDGALLFLATGYMADRNRKAYLQGISPDVVVPYSLATEPDQTLEAARRWLQGAK